MHRIACPPHSTAWQQIVTRHLGLRFELEYLVISSNRSPTGFENGFEQEPQEALSSSDPWMSQFPPPRSWSETETEHEEIDSMVQNPPANMPRLSPNVFYDDPAAALEWLHKSFGFEIRMKMPGPDGSIIHAEMEIGDAVVMMSPASSEPEWKSPASIGGSVTQSLYVYVDDVEAHCQRARGAGAEVISDLEDMFWGDKTYVTRDLEGHRWTFAQATRVVAPEDMAPAQIAHRSRHSRSGRSVRGPKALGSPALLRDDARQAGVE